MVGPSRRARIPISLSASKWYELATAQGCAVVVPSVHELRRFSVLRDLSVASSWCKKPADPGCKGSDYSAECVESKASADLSLGFMKIRGEAGRMSLSLVCLCDFDLNQQQKMAPRMRRSSFRNSARRGASLCRTGLPHQSTSPRRRRRSAPGRVMRSRVRSRRSRAAPRPSECAACTCPWSAWYRRCSTRRGPAPARG